MAATLPPNSAFPNIGRTLLSINKITDKIAVAVYKVTLKPKAPLSTLNGVGLAWKYKKKCYFWLNLQSGKHKSRKNYIVILKTTPISICTKINYKSKVNIIWPNSGNIKFVKFIKKHCCICIWSSCIQIVFQFFQKFVKLIEFIALNANLYSYLLLILHFLKKKPP